MSNIIPFKYQEKEIRIVEDSEGNPWWVAKDVCDALGIKNPSQAIEFLDDDERSMFNIGRQGEVNIISESGLYGLITNSRKEEAKSFQRWVRKDVLPSIRKTGSYSLPDHEPETLVPVSREFKAAVAIARAAGLKGNQAVLCANKAVRRIMGVNTLEIINATHLICEEQEIHLTASDLGKLLGLSGQKANRLLESHGLIESFRDHKNRLKWRSTAKGSPFTVLKDTGKKLSDGTPIQQMFFLESIKTQIEGNA
jgi:prophage antirepressor-like protein